jgi:hypothetical protein
MPVRRIVVNRFVAIGLIMTEYYYNGLCLNLKDFKDFLEQIILRQSCRA